MTTTPPGTVSAGRPTSPRSTPTTLHYDVLGSSVAVEVHDVPLAADLDRLLRPFTTGPCPADAVYTLIVDGRGCWLRHGDLAYRHDTPDLMLEALLADINALALGSYGGLAVHAGVVGRDGQALCLPGPSGAGKSTLTAACVLAGLDYLSDEALCLETETGEVTPYPRPLALSPTSWRLLRADREGQADATIAGADRLCTASALGGRSTSAPHVLAHVVHFDRQSGPTLLEPVDRSETMAALISLSFNLHLAPEANLSSIAATTRASGSWRLRYDDPLSAAELLAELLA